MLRLLSEANWPDIQREMSRMLREGIQSANVRKLAELAISNKEDHVVAIHQFVKLHFPYAPDPADMELFIHPNRMALDYFDGRQRMGDCDDLALLTAAMMGSIGYSVRIQLIDVNLDGEIDHAVSQVKDGVLGWLNIDSSNTKPLGWELPTTHTITVEP